MTIATHDRAKLARVWAESALAQIRAVQTDDAMADWIVANRYRLADVDQYAYGDWLKIKIAVDLRWREIAR